MASNPKTSKWYATARNARKRKGVEFKLAPETIEKLDEMAPPGTRSAFVEALIVAAYEKRNKRT
jgi:predicted DNA-binding protein (MmcQ/YjbR family)